MQKREVVVRVNESLEMGNLPRIHPNGFIQLDLDANGSKRLHVWRNDLPRQKVYTPVHNHRFSFNSVTVAGALCNIAFALKRSYEGPPHQRWAVRRNPESEETILVPTGQLVGLVATKASLITPGRGYAFPAGAFHETSFVHNTVTIIEKSDPVPGIEAAVLVPAGIEPDNSFIRALPSVEDIQRKIFEALA